MKILLMSTHLNIGGIAVYTTSLAKSLSKRGNRVMVISSGGDMVEELENEGISHTKVNIKTKSELSPKIWLNLSNIVKLIEKEKPDLIHAQTRVTQVLAAVLAKKFNIPYVSTCHGFFKKRISRRFFDCWGDKVIAISEPVKNHLIGDFNVDRKRIELIHNGVDIERFDKEFSKEDIHSARQSLGLNSDYIIGTIGRLSPVKGLDSLINAFKESSILNKKAELLIVGDGPDKEKLKSLANELNIKSKVHFIESSLNTPKLLSIMDVFVFPSVQEGLGLSLIEALASGRAVVATDAGGIKSLIKDNQSGLLTEIGDKKALSQAMCKLLENEELRTKLAQNGREIVKNEFSLDKMVERTETLYKSLI